MVAAARGKPNFVSALLAHGADINAEDAVCLPILIEFLSRGLNVLFVGQLDATSICCQRRS
jgi:hypothetical protein